LKKFAVLSKTFEVNFSRTLKLQEKKHSKPAFSPLSRLCLHDNVAGLLATCICETLNANVMPYSIIQAKSLKVVTPAGSAAFKVSNNGKEI
jgi:hypothetical protein